MLGGIQSFGLKLRFAKMIIIYITGVFLAFTLI